MRKKSREQQTCVRHLPWDAVSTEVHTSMVLATTTVFASIPASIASAASQWYADQFESMKSEIDASATPPSAFPTSLPSTSSVGTYWVPADGSFVGVTLAMTPSTVTQASTTHTTLSTATMAGRLGFCGAPGTPCLRGRDVEEEGFETRSWPGGGFETTYTTWLAPIVAPLQSPTTTSTDDLIVAKTTTTTPGVLEATYLSFRAHHTTTPTSREMFNPGF